MKTVVTNSEEETEKLAENIGGRLLGGETIELVSDLGGGKTTFVRGLAKGTGSTDHVSSPTFTLSKVYKSPNFEIRHFDFYRLQDAGILAHELDDLVGDDKTVVVVEWAEAVHSVLPEDRLMIRISATGETKREIKLDFPDKLKYLVA